MRRVLHLGLACAVGAVALGVHTETRAGDGGWPTGDAGGWPSLDSGTEAAASEAGSDAATPVQPECAYPAGYGDGTTPPNTMSPNAILAYYCGDAEMQCVTAPIAFDKTIDLKDTWPDWAQGFDTDWIPKNFPELQVRFVLKIPAETQVKLGGDFRATWPDALTIVTPGSRLSGFLKFDYGLILSGRYKIDVEILGFDVDYEDDIPYFPQVNFHLLGMQAFDSWGFAPNGAEASALSPKIQVFEFNIGQLVGIPDEIGEAGLRLNIAGELKANYETLKIQVTPSVAPITTENGTTLDNFVGGGFVEYDVHPEGKVTYDGVIHLIPTFYVELIGGAASFEIPVIDYGVSMTDLYEMATGNTADFLVQDFVFDNTRIHVPLPDVPRLEKQVYDFGKVPVGSGEKLTVPVPNWGEAKARAWGQVDESMKTVFDIMTPSLLIDPCTTEELKIRFKPKKEGPFKTTLTLYSNDPDTPSQEIELRGEAVGDDYVDPDGGTGPGVDPHSDGGLTADVPGSGDDGGCGCSVTKSDAGAAGVLAGLGMIALVASRRRGRAGRKCD